MRIGMNSIVLSSIAIAAASTFATADIVIGNLGDTSGPGSAFGSNSTANYKAAGFTMTGDYFLDSVTLTVGLSANGATPNMQIWEGDGEPLTLLYDMPDFILPEVFLGIPQDFVWTPGSQIQLNSGTTYWVYMDNSAAGENWNWDSGFTTPIGDGGIGAGYSFNGNPSSFRNTFQVNGTLVPAPGVLAMLGVAGLAARRKRRM